MAKKKCCGGRVSTATVELRSKTEPQTPDTDAQVLYIASGGSTTWQAPSGAVYVASQSKPLLDCFSQDKAWLLSRQERGKFFFTPVNEEVKKEVAIEKPETTIAKPKRKYTKRKKTNE